MSDYINRDELLKIRPFTVCGGWICRDYDEGFLDCADEAREAIKNMPAADVVEVKHGKWDRNPIAIVCSECGKAFGLVEMFAHYCPSCGAKMDLEG